MLKVITVIRPETLVRWHRAGFRHYWRWKSRSFGGRPQITLNHLGRELFPLEWTGEEHKARRALISQQKFYASGS